MFLSQTTIIIFSLSYLLDLCFVDFLDVKMDVDYSLDACGLECPMPLLKAKQMLNRLEYGQTLLVSATDSGSVRDFRTFAELSGHELLLSDENAGVYRYLIRKR
jgi:TusA-related sulfurtransferase